MFLYDTPGVMVPKIDSEETALNLAITGEFLYVVNIRAILTFV